MTRQGYDVLWDERAELYGDLERAQHEVREIKAKIKAYDKAIKALQAGGEETA